MRRDRTPKSTRTGNVGPGGGVPGCHPAALGDRPVFPDPCLPPVGTPRVFRSVSSTVRGGGRGRTDALFRVDAEAVPACQGVAAGSSTTLTSSIAGPPYR